MAVIRLVLAFSLLDFHIGVDRIGDEQNKEIPAVKKQSGRQGHQQLLKAAL